MSFVVPAFRLAFVIVLLSTGASGGQIPSGYIPVGKGEYFSFPKVPQYRGFLPEHVDLSENFPKPGEQGKLQSCTGWAVGYAARSFYAHKIEGRELNSTKDTPSPSYIYNSIRTSDDCNSGATLPDALQLLLTRGSLSIAAYGDPEACRRPTQSQAQAATDFRIENWFRFDLNVVDDLKSELAKGQPIIIGMNVDESFLLVKGSQVYSGQERRAGGHAMTIVGYDERTQAFKIINSWGTAWGDKGFGWISFDAFLRSGVEAYVMEVKPKPLVEPSPEPMVVAPAPIPAPAPVPKVEPVVVTPIPHPIPKPVPKVEPTSPIQPKPFPAIVKPIGPPSVDCSRLSFDRDGDHTIVSGFVGTQEELDNARKIYIGPQYKIEVQLRPWPQCEVLMTLEKPLRSRDRPVVKTGNAQVVFKTSDKIIFEIKSPAHPSFIYVSYVQADGSVINLEQPVFPVSAPSLSTKEYKFGDGLQGRPRFTASPPFGREMVIVLAAASPLFENKLPRNQTEREYLSTLRKAILYKANPLLPDRNISAAFLGIETREK